MPNIGGNNGTVSSISTTAAGNTAAIGYPDNTTNPPSTRTEYYGPPIPESFFRLLLAAYGKNDGKVDVTVDGDPPAISGVTAH